MAGKTDFGRINADIAKSAEVKANRGNTTYTKVSWFSPKFGDNLFMVLPPFDENSHLYKQVFVHHNFLDTFEDGKEKKRAYLCSKENFGSCPICDQVAKLRESGDTEDEEKATKITGRKTFLYNLVDAHGSHAIGSFKPSQHDELMQEINQNYIDEGLDVTDPLNGVQIKLSRTKQSPWARCRAKTNANPGYTEQEIANLIGQSVDLTKVYTRHTPEELTRMLNGEVLSYGASTEGVTEESLSEVVDNMTEKEQDELEAKLKAAIEAKEKAKLETKTETPPAEKKATRGRPAKTTVDTPPPIEASTTTTTPATSGEDAELDNILGMLEE